MKNKRVLKFIVWTYLSFWAGLMLTGGLMYLGASDSVVSAMATICAWAPTFVFFILFHKLLPDEMNRRSYIKKLFKGKHIVRLSVSIVLVQTALFFLSIFLIAKNTEQNMTSLFQMNLLLLLYAVFNTLINGATGEELGWRGFLHFELAQKYGIIKGSLLVGVFWSFWHTPLWFITSGYQGWKLLIFIIVFLVSNISASVAIGILYNQKKNLLIPIIIHYLFNFWVEFYTGELLILLGVLAVLYLVTTIGIVIWYHKSIANGEEIWLIKKNSVSI